jgi:hypothetical protein
MSEPKIEIERPAQKRTKAPLLQRGDERRRTIRQDSGHVYRRSR